MPTITLNKTVFEKYVGKKLSIEQLKERISYLGTDLESIEGNEIRVEVFPNRPDLLSEQGFARAFSSFVGIKTGLQKYKVKKSSHRVKVDSSVKSVRPYTTCAIIKNMKFTDEKIREVIQIQEKLHITYGRNRKKAAIGIYPFEKIIPPIYYKALPPEKIKFRPLGSERELTAQQILTDHPAGKEYGYLLKGKNIYPVFTDSQNKILSLPPIINSYETGRISEKTKEIFIECSGFERGSLNILLNIIVTALADMGGEIYSLEIYDEKKFTTPDLSLKKMKVDKSYVNNLLGLNLQDYEIRKLVERMGYSYINKHVLIPPYRADILHPIDIVEDIAIAYGYENFRPELPSIATIGKENENEVFKKKILEILVGLNLIETSSYILISKETIEKTKTRFKGLEIKNPINKEFNVLRPSLLPSFLQIFAENQHNEYPQKICEINTVFEGEKEKTNLAIGITHEKTNFTELKQICDALFVALDKCYTLRQIKHHLFIEGRTGEILINKIPYGVIGEVSPEVLINFKLTNPVSLLEMDIEGLKEEIET